MVQLKFYPFTPLSLLFYKFLRCYAAVVVTVVQLVLRRFVIVSPCPHAALTLPSLRSTGTPVAGLDSGLLILYISSARCYHVLALTLPWGARFAEQVAFHVTLLSKIPRWTAYKRALKKPNAVVKAGSRRNSLSAPFIGAVAVAGGLSSHATQPQTVGHSQSQSALMKASRSFSLNSEGDGPIAQQRGAAIAASNSRG